MRISRAIDLKVRLALRVAALAALCFIAASAYIIFDSARSDRTKMGGIAEIVAKDLELQQNQLRWIKPPLNGFPDLETIATSLRAPGLCIAYRTNEGNVLQRFCNGSQPEEINAPAVFATLYRSIFGKDMTAIYPIRFESDVKGAAVITIDPATLISHAWRETSRLLALMAIVLSALCILVYAALAWALRPVGLIVSGLERLADNDLSVRLPSFDLAELSSVGTVFNMLAETLQTTLAERNELTQRLIAVQDEERRHLARELHDEFGQCLAAISAVAASAGQTAEAEYPALVPECRSIAQTTAHMMETLRGTLLRLRSPEVEELGLTASLQGLISGWNSRSRGRTSFEIEVRGDFDALPAPFGASLYRIAQEALTNAVKHAQATRVSLHVEMSEAIVGSSHHSARNIELTVADDGILRDINLVGNSGMGLAGIRERVDALGGRLRFEPRHPAGLILHAMIPAPYSANG